MQTILETEFVFKTAKEFMRKRSSGLQLKKNCSAQTKQKARFIGISYKWKNITKNKYNG